jgi:hypothetical protein
MMIREGDGRDASRVSAGMRTEQIRNVFGIVSATEHSTKTCWIDKNRVILRLHAYSRDSQDKLKDGTDEDGSPAKEGLSGGWKLIYGLILLETSRRYLFRTSGGRGNQEVNLTEMRGLLAL